MELCYAFLDRAAGELGCPCVAGEPMSRHTTFQIGGPADRFITVETLPQLKGLVKALGQEGLPFLLLGKGSNLLVGDRGFRGAVLLLSGDFKKVEQREEGLLRAGAGASLASVCAFARERGLSGLEFAWGIPGSAGGAAYMDAGAYGGEMKDVVERVCHLTPQGEEGSARGEELQFSYRRSRYTGGREIDRSPPGIWPEPAAACPCPERSGTSLWRPCQTRQYTAWPCHSAGPAGKTAAGKGPAAPACLPAPSQRPGPQACPGFGTPARGPCPQ